MTEASAATAAPASVVPSAAEAQHASEVLRALAADPNPRLSLDEVVSRLDDRTFGIVFLILALINCMPLPPGVSTVTGIAMMLAALQLALGRHRLWLPAALCRRSVSRSSFRAAANRALPWLERLERMCRPRYSWLTSGISERLLGVVVLVLAFVIMLPIPVIGNIPPGIAVAILAISLLERDGLAALAGMAVGIIAFAINISVVGAALFAIFAPAGRFILDWL